MKISKRIHKAISFLLSFVLLFQSFAPVVIYAQEVLDPTPTAEVTEFLTPEPSPSVIPSEVEESLSETPTVTPEPTGLPTQTAEPSAGQILDEAASTTAGDLTVAVVSEPSPSVIPSEVEESLSSPTAQESASLSTDKADYAPTDTAVIGGSSLQPNTTYKLVISSSDDPAVRFETEITTNNEGSFYYSYQLDGNYRPNYLVELFLGSELILSTTFTDAQPPSADLDQCGNGSTASPDDPCVWQNGNLHTGNSHYVEGQSVPYRVVMENLPTGTPITLTLGYDIKHSSKHALDFLTHYDRLEPHNSFGHLSEEIDPSDGILGFSGTTTTFTIPTPDTTNSPVAGEPATNFGTLPPTEKVMTLFGGTITNVAYTTNGDLTAAQSETEIDVTFTVDSQTAILAWGGHIASRLYWGANNSAGGISGSPYHMRLKDWNLNNLGNQDRSLSADAVIPPGNLTIIKNVVPNDSSVWDFTLTGNNINNTSAQDIPDGGSYAYSLPAGNYTVTEASDQNYTPSVVCNSGETGTNSVTVNLASDENVVCTFTNNRNLASLTLVKNLVKDNGGSANETDWTLSASGQTSISGASGSSAITNASVSPGTYNLSESGGPTGYSASDWSCAKNGGQAVNGNTIDLATNDSTVCTITNDDIAPSLTLDKIVSNTHGGLQLETAWTLTATGPTTISGPGAAGANDVVSGPTFWAGTYTLSETGPGGYLASGWTCTGSTQNGDQIALGVGQTSTCSITNSDIPATLIVKKHVENNNGGTLNANNFTMMVAGTNVSNASFPGSEAGTTVTLNAGPYGVDEGAHIGYTKTLSADCSGSIALGETKTCTITNDDIASQLTIIKNVLDPDGNDVSDTHAFTANVGTISAQIAEGGNAVLGINAGIYTVTETPDPNYENLGCTLPNGAEATNFSLNPGQALSVTCKNKQKKATITVYKNVVAADETTDILDTHSFTISLGGQNDHFAEDSPAIFSVNPGDFAATESNPPDTNYTFVRNSGPVAVGSNGQASITIVNKQPPGSILGYKYDATTGLGIFGWIINLSGDIAGSTTTDINGFYQFLGLNTGSYLVSEDQPTGWTPISQTSYNVTINPGTESTENDFTNFHNISISGEKYNDLNGDGQKETGEPGLSNWTIRLQNTDGVVLSTTTTDSSGNYSFTDLGPGTYRLREVLKPGWVQTSTNPLDINASSGNNVTGINFGNFNFGQISGNKYSDLNQDGNDINEPNLPSWTIYLDTNNNGALDSGEPSTITDSNGHYLFSNLGPSTYHVREVNQDGWTQIEPVGGVYNITMTSNGNKTQKDFGNHRNTGDLQVQKVIDDQSDLSQWQFSLDGQPAIFANTRGVVDFGQVDTLTTHTITETGPNGYHLVSISQNCNPDGDTAYTTISKDETKVCTFTNARDIGTITIDKVTDPREVANQFTLNLYQSENLIHSSVLADTTTPDTFSVPTGSYNLTELDNSGWQLTNATCTKGEENSFDPRQTSVLVNSGDSINCTFTNTAIAPRLTLTKTNNASGDKHPGEEVTFTLTLTVSNSGVNDPKVIDLPAKGFKYRPGSYKVLVRGLDITSTLTEPAYHSPGTWELPNLNANDQVVMTYIADIDSAETPGLYHDLAWAKGTSLTGDSLLAEGSDGNFVGTEVNVVKSTQDNPTMDVIKEEKIEGQVLGATTILPATGADTRWLYLAIILGVLGTASTSAGVILNKKKND